MSKHEKELGNIKQLISQKLQEAKLGHDEFFPHKTEYQQMDEADKILLAIEDIQDKLELPVCPDCGGRLIFTDKNKGGGIVCVGQPTMDKEGEYYQYDNGCSFHGYTMSTTNPVKLERCEQ